jgi:ABC-type multidrug transport system fused ATPase/permease subunit
MLGSPNPASDAELVAACEAAQCHNLIMDLSDGYHTEVGPGAGGGLLSGGQKQ